MNFEHYSWLIAIPIALALVGALFLACAQARRRLVRKFASDRLVQQLLANYSPLRRKLKNGLILTALALVIVALARPQWGYDWQESKSKGIDIMFVVDVSKSMLARDIKPNRLDRSKLAILDFLEQLEGDRVGLVAFAGNAFLQCPLTLDYDAFRQSLEAIDTNVISLGGTDIARAITEAEAAFPDDNNHKILVMITDGEDLEADGVIRAQEASENGITIYTVGVGTPEGELIPVTNRYGQTSYLRDDNGEYVRTQLDADTLNEIAEVTNGFYAPLGPTGYGLEQVYEAGLQSIPEQELASRMEKVWVERFQWPLGLAIILLAWEPLIGTRRTTLRRKAKVTGVKTSSASTVAKTALWALLLCVIFSSSELSASVREGEKFFRDGDYAQAAEEFQAALEADPLNAQASFNLGNALQALEKPEEAQAAYGRALATTDLDLQADAFYNLGSLKFTEAQKKLAEADIPAAAKQSGEANRNIELAIEQGRHVLAEAQSLPPAQPGQPDPGQAIMQKAQQALQFAEQAKSGGEATTEAATAAQSVGKPVAEVWSEAANDFQSSLSLKPNGDDAAHNYNYVQEQTEDLKRQLSQLKRAKESISANQPELERIIEELKKLIEQQQQDQDNQQQDQQQNQQQQSQQNQQNQSQQQQSESQGNQQQQQQSNNSQQNQQEQSDEQQGQQQSQEQQTESEQQQSSEGEEQSNEEQSGEQQDAQTAEQEDQPSENQQQTKGEQSESDKEKGPQRDSSEVDKMIDAMENEQKAQAGEESEQSGGEQKTDQPKAEPMTLSEEDAKQLQQQAAQAAGEMEAAEGELPEAAVPIGEMSRDDARRLLESLKRYEKKLPVSGYGRPQSKRDDEGKRKDW